VFIFKKVIASGSMTGTAPLERLYYYLMPYGYCFYSCIYKVLVVYLFQNFGLVPIPASKFILIRIFPLIFCLCICVQTDCSKSYSAYAGDVVPTQGAFIHCRSLTSRSQCTFKIIQCFSGMFWQVVSRRASLSNDRSNFSIVLPP